MAFSWLRTAPPPSVYVEIAARRVGAIATTRRGAATSIAGYAVEPLAAGVLAPAVGAGNVLDAAALEATIWRVFERLGARPRRVGLIIPDSTAKVSLVRFERPPARQQDLEQLIHWQIRKNTPFRIEEAQVSYTLGAPPPEGGVEYVVAAARRDVIEEYERACSAAGAHAGLVDLSTFNVINAALKSRPLEGDWLLVHVMDASSTIAVMRRGAVILFRHRPSEAEDQLADLVHQTAMYYEDRLGGAGFERVVVAGAGPDAAAQAAMVERRLGGAVERLDVREAAPLEDRISAPPELLDALVPMAGMAVREAA
jgi:type IV pilus assembly protein PilM